TRSKRDWSSDVCSSDLTTFSLIAVFLALIGLYGVMSRYVAYRNRELGIRLAIGAPPRRVLSLILYKGLILTAAGISIGGLGALRSEERRVGKEWRRRGA